MDVSLKQIEKLLALDRFRHFGRAADFLGISQPALTRSVQAVERELCVPLFTRSRTGVEPTRAGVLFLERGRDLLEASARMLEELGERGAAEENELNIVCALYPAVLSMPTALNALMHEMPGLKLRTVIADWKRANELLGDGSVNLILSEPDEERRYCTRPINQEPVCLVVRRGHPLARLKRPTLEQVVSHPWVCTLIPARAARFMGNPAQAGDLDPETGVFVPAVLAPSPLVALEMVTRTDLVAVEPLLIAHEHIESGELELVRFRAPWMCLNYGFSWRPGDRLTRPARRFVELVKDAERALQREERALARHYRCDSWPEH